MNVIKTTTWFLLIMLFTACNATTENEKQEPKLVNPTSPNVKQSCVVQVMHMDDSLAAIRNQACVDISLSETIDNYVKGMETLDFEGCPQLFSQAFKQHVQSWRDMTFLTNKYPDLRGEMHDLFDELKVSPDSAWFNKRLKVIEDTWNLIEYAKK